MPTWSIIHSRHWKMQIPYLARHCRVVTFDGRGNGRSDRPAEPDAYDEEEFAADALAVMDATRPSGCAGVALTRRRTVADARCDHPERVERRCSSLRRCRCHRSWRATEPLTSSSSRTTSTAIGGSGTALLARAVRGLPRVLLFAVFTELHSTKQREDAVGWGLETDAETLVATQLAPRLQDEEAYASSCLGSAARCS